jgi:ribosomal protein S18 acetylase RimI-like enzyme
VNLQFREQPPEFIRHYGAVPVAFDVRERMAIDMIGSDSGDVRLSRCAVQSPYAKDYDALPGNSPLDWAERWDLSKWCLCAAFFEGQHIGGAAIVIDTSEVYGSRGDVDEAVLWDIRVRPDQRNRGVGRQFLAFAEHRACSAGKRRLSVETQNNNVAACRLYAGAGFLLRSFDRFAYPMLPNEVQLIWSKELAGPASAR